MIKGNWQTKEVQIGDRYLDLHSSLKIINHSPTGFNWGYGGAGPAQLALALLMEFMPNRQEVAQNNYHKFKLDVISTLPQEDFEMKEDVVLDWINEHAKENIN